MSDIKAALEHTEQLSHAAAAATEKQCKFPVAVLPANMSIHNLEQYQEQRNQFRGNVSTHKIADFLAYTNLQAKGSCFVDSKDMKARAYFDIGSISAPGHCKHTAYISMRTTAAYRALTAINGQRQSQQELAEFMEDWQDDLRILDADREAMDSKKAIRAVRNVKIDETTKSEHGVSTFSQNKSAIEQLNAAGKDDEPLPSFIEFTCNPYVGLGERAFTVRIYMVISRGEKPQFTTRIIKLDEAEEDMNQEFYDLIADDIDDSVSLYVGHFSADG